MGCNANPLGGWGIITATLRQWAARVRIKLAAWPVSRGVALAVIDGLVINRFVFRFLVNTPPGKLCGTVVSAICKLYRVVFGLSPRTPRDVLFDTIQCNPPDMKLWVTVVLEMHKAFNSVNADLRDLMWGQWLQCGAMHHNPDLWRVKSRLKVMDMSLLRVLSSKQVDSWEIDQDLRKTCSHVYITGDASEGMEWAGMVQVSTDNEEILLNNKVFFPAEGLSSTLTEATVVISAIVALYRWVERTPPPPPLFKTWVWSDSLGTMVTVPLGECLQVPGDVVDKLMVWVGGCPRLVDIEWGWVQAQHDSKKKRTGSRN